MKGSLVSSEIAEPYAQALMSLSEANQLTKNWAEDMEGLLELLDESPELQEFLASPVVKPEDKKAVLRKVLGDKVEPYLLNFFDLLADKRRIPFIKEIALQYLVLWRQLTNTVLAEVTSASELTEIQRQLVIDKVKSLTGALSIALKSTIDPELIGGMIIKVGSQVYDASLRNQIRQIGLSMMN